MAKSKFFRVAVEGATATDGRTITREMLTDVASNFNRDTYGPRINMEHIRGFSAEGPFNAYGDVLAVRTEEVEIELAGKKEKRLGLFAQLEPTDALVEVNRKRQKIYTSIEVQPNFGGSGKYGLIGLAVTDSPASLGTEILKFSTKSDDAAAAAVKADLDRRKQGKDNLFSAALETTMDMESETPAKEESALEKFAALILNGLKPKEEAKPEPKPEPKPADPAAGDFNALFSGLLTAITADRQADKSAADTKFAQLTQSIESLKNTIETTPSRNHTARPASPGGAGGRVKADC